MKTKGFIQRTKEKHPTEYPSILLFHWLRLNKEASGLSSEAIAIENWIITALNRAEGIKEENDQ